MKELFIFDGNCGFCTKTVDYLIKLDRNKLVDFIPYQVFEKSSEQEYACDFSKSIVYIENHQYFTGARGFMKFLDRITGLSLFSRIYNFPLLGSCMEAVYRLVAKNRRYLPGTTPWCDRQNNC
ncbi:thiol-disulfide oxidoreductase DCC family protein [Rothia sp. CCM 9417]|uniref:thiol-disulfide oxidoreductase DCC family protein n=1 Tax=Rothia sp. CCM 9417 TaxID=3402657 RepID=UPI003AE8D531